MKKNFVYPLALALSSILLSTVTPALAQSFHFTVTADMRGYHSAFANVCQSINEELGGPGEFHISLGDIDNSIPSNRIVINRFFGHSFSWYPLVGNHEVETGDDMRWLRDEYDNGNLARTPIKDLTNQDGPTGTVRLNYTWDFGNAHFVALNQYWNGGINEGNGTQLSGDDTDTDGDVVPELLDWLAEDLAANTRPFVFVLGHEPAFPYHRHVGDSLDKYPHNRDAFWQLMEDYGVQVYLCGHTHYYSKHQGDKNHIGNVWQLDAGNAGNNMGDGWTYFDIIVESDLATINVYRDFNTRNFVLADSITVVPEPATITIMLLGCCLAIRQRRR